MNAAGGLPRFDEQHLGHSPPPDQRLAGHENETWFDRPWGLTAHIFAAWCDFCAFLQGSPPAGRAKPGCFTPIPRPKPANRCCNASPKFRRRNYVITQYYATLAPACALLSKHDNHLATA
jgi:hypothetical protein